MYANTQTDTDTVIKPITAGFDASSVLRSAQSPQELAYRLLGPSGTSLEQEQGSGPVRLIANGQAIATIPVPSATDAEGTNVPVTMVASGDTLTLTVDRRAGSYRYPIIVDPTVIDNIFWLGLEHSNWAYSTSNPSVFHQSGSEISYASGTYGPGEKAYFVYHTQGKSHIYAFYTEAEINDYNFEGGIAVLNAMTIASPGQGQEGEEHLSYWGSKTVGVCAEGSCAPKGVGKNAENRAYFEIRTLETRHEYFRAQLWGTDVYILQEQSPSASLDTTDATLNGSPNAASGEWTNSTKAGNAVLGVNAWDPGIGINADGAKSPNKAEWGFAPREERAGECAGAQCNECDQSECPAHATGKPLALPFANLGELPDGEDTVEATVQDGVGLTATATGKVRIDNIAPHNLVLTGLPTGNEIGETPVSVRVEATDGAGTTPSSGVKSIALAVDGHEIGTPAGHCVAGAGPCTASAEWSLNGGELGVGEHKLTITATDNAGNVATETIAAKVHHASPVALGPGAVNPESGEYDMAATDVSVGAPGANLTVERSYRSRHAAPGSEGPLGPQWSLSVGGQESLAKLPNGNVTLSPSSGGQVTFVDGYGHFVSPTGDSNLALTEVHNEKGELTEYVLRNASDAATTHFTSSSGPSASLWKPTTQEGPLASQTVRYVYQTLEGVIEPRYALAPEPAGLGYSCISKLEKSEHLEKGCRALEFRYASSTSATGENESQWNAYKGRLQEVRFIAYDPSSKAMAEPAVAQYAYDSQGRLRAEWDPRISPLLKTLYGYDPEGHLSAYTAPGRESWGLTYGTLAGHLGTGWLLKAAQAPASSSLWNGEGAKNTVAPKLSGTPVVGVSLGVSTGTWSNGPISYGYQWEDCYAEGTGCTPIAGATNPSYTVTESDVGYELVAQITATNGGGSVVTASAPSEEVKLSVVTEYNLSEAISPQQIASGPDGNLWVLDVPGSGTQKVVKVSTTGSVGGEYALPSGSAPSCIVVGPDHNLWFTDHGTSKIGKITTSGTLTEYSLPSGSSPECIASGPDGNLWFSDYGTSKIGKITTAGTVLAEYALPAGSQPSGIAVGPDGKLWFTDRGTKKIGKITTAGTITEYALPEGSPPSSIIAGPNETMWFLRFSGIEKTTTAGVVTTVVKQNAYIGYDGIALGPDNNVWFTSHRRQIGHMYDIGRITPSGGSRESRLPNEAAGAIVAGPEEDMWFTEAAHAIGKATTTPQTAKNGEARGPEPGWTVEYSVPVSGASAPYALGASEVEAWAQKDDPVEGVAIFPPDEAQGWPASGYKRATVSYWDSHGSVVNTVTPSGGVATSEYNSNNDVVRTLSPDNRAAALKEGCESKAKCKSAEAAKLLDSESTYNEGGSEPGTELLSTLGPQHTVELTNRTQTEARTHTVYSYDEGRPSEGGPYHLVTKTTQGAQIAGAEEPESVRTATLSYSGQEGIGWKLRKATSTTTDPAGLDLVTKTFYDPTSGNVVETRSPAGNSETIYPPAYASIFGSEGSGNGQLSEPRGVATDSAGNIWVADQNNNRIEKFSASGTWLASYGTKGTGNLQFEKPWGTAINQSTGNVYVADRANNRIEELSSSGTFVASFGNSGEGKLKEPTGVALDVAGDVWVSDKANNRVVEFSSEGTFTRAFGTLGSGNGQLSAPQGIAISEGSVYVVDSGNSRVEQFSATGSYIGQFGSKGSGAGQFKEPFGIAANPSTGVLYVADASNSRIEEFSPAGRLLTEWGTWGPKHENSSPNGLAVAANGTLYDANLHSGQVLTWTPPEAGAAHLTYGSQFGSSGSGNGQFSYPKYTAIDGEGNVWVSDCGNNRIEKFSAKGAFLAAYGKAGSGEVQFNCPTGIDINQSAHDIYVSDSENKRIEELSLTGAYVRSFGTSGEGALTKPGGLKIDSAGNVWVPDLSADRIVEFSSSGTFIAKYGKEGTGEVQFKKPVALAFAGENLYVSDQLNHRVEELSNKGAYIRSWGIEGAGSGEFYAPEGIASDAASNLYVVDDGSAHVEEFTSTGVYRGTFGTAGSGEGQLKGPAGDSIDAAGNMYVVDNENNRVEKWDRINQAVHDSKTIYYTASGSGECQGHPEWANLPCKSEPAAQPETSGLPTLPVTEYKSYNLWNEPEETIEHVGASTRTATTSYDAAGRPKTSATSSTEGTALPAVTYGYTAETGAETGALTSQSAEGKKITSVYNTLGQLTTYTDADGNAATYEYDVDGRMKNANDGKGTQTFTYDGTTGLLAELVDSSAEGMKFTASHDAEGKLLTKSYPNGVAATYTYNATGTATGLEYKKTTHCTEEGGKCKWLTDTIVPSSHGQWLEQTSSLSHQAYTYDADSRLTQVQSTPAGKGCTTHLYHYDESTNDTSTTTREPGTEGKCASEGGTTETHTYDEADRLVDGGVSYSTFGDITALPASDAGGSPLTSSYFVDNQLQSQTQNGETIGYYLDPAGRTRETISSGKTASDVVSHFAGASTAPAWTVNTSGEATRFIMGINGQLAAIQRGLEAPVLQLTNLHGDVVATAAMSESATELASKTDTSEYGVPTVSAPPLYSWLGGDELPTGLPSGIIAMGARSYVPELGRFLQPDPVRGGSANAYAYTFGDPVNASDPSGEYTITIDEFDEKYTTERAEASAAARAAEIRAAEEAAARAAAEQRAAQAAREGEIARILGEGAGRVLYEAEGFGCSGADACAATSIFGFKVDLGEVEDWWQHVKTGWRLVKETVVQPFLQNLKENSTVCKATNYALAAGSYFVPENKFAKALGVALGLSATYAC